MRLGLGLGIGFSSNQRGGTPQKMVKYLFIDAGCIDNRLKQMSETFAEAAPLSLAWPSLAAGYEKVFFYDALPGQKRSEHDEDYELRRDAAEQRHLYLQTLDRFRVYQGDARWRSGRGHEQKKVDVMIAVDMLKHTIRRNMQAAALLTSDVDFRPLLDALVDEGMFVTLIYNPSNTSQELLGAADARLPLSCYQMWSWLNDASRALVGFISPITTGECRNGPLVNAWVDPRVGMVEVRERNPAQGGWSDALYYLQWQETGQSGWNYLATSTLEKIYHVAKFDVGIVMPEAAAQ